jgi:hypothetical protein
MRTAALTEKMFSLPHMPFYPTLPSHGTLTENELRQCTWLIEMGLRSQSWDVEERGSNLMQALALLSWEGEEMEEGA